MSVEINANWDGVRVNINTNNSSPVKYKAD